MPLLPHVVPAPRSCWSSRQTGRPRSAASRATPAPVMPAPTTTTSNSPPARLSGGAVGVSCGTASLCRSAHHAGVVSTYRLPRRCPMGRMRGMEGLTRGTVLLAEAEPSVAMAVTSRLDEDGIDVRWVRTIREARGELTSNPPDLLVLDTALATDGREV